MTSYQISLTPSRRAATRFIGLVRRALQCAYIEEQQKNGLSQSDIARALKVHRSVINRELKGVKDLTLGRVGELSWAMGRNPVFLLEEIQANVSANFPITSTLQAVPSHLPPLTTTVALRSLSSIDQIATSVSAA
ncbi:MAG: helix-turn-helix domain-containing protein [Alphaproteobacteria bacterium]|nr:helix-turn-helix domain-containing protein [Alphaproteobacteria bacterium]